MHGGTSSPTQEHRQAKGPHDTLSLAADCCTTALSHGSFLKSMHERETRLGRTDGFLWKQFVVCTNAYAVPLWAAEPLPLPSTLSLCSGSLARKRNALLQLAGWPVATVNPASLKNEESQQHPDIFVCDGTSQPWPAFWKEHRRFG